MNTIQSIIVTFNLKPKLTIIQSEYNILLLCDLRNLVTQILGKRWKTNMVYYTDETPGVNKRMVAGYYLFLVLIGLRLIIDVGRILHFAGKEENEG